MSNSNKVLFSFIAGAAAGILAATLISKEDREKIAAKLKDKATRLREKLASELDELNSKMNANNNS